LHIGVQVNRINDHDIWSPLGNGTDGLTDASERQAKTLSPMSRNEDDPRPIRWREMKIRKMSRQAPVNLFWERIVFPPGTKACFDVPNRNVVVISGEGGREGGGRISLDQHRGRALLPEDIV